MKLSEKQKAWLRERELANAPKPKTSFLSCIGCLIAGHRQGDRLNWNYVVCKDCGAAYYDPYDPMI